jgi:hypothetical protein
MIYQFQYNPSYKRIFTLDNDIIMNYLYNSLKITLFHVLIQNEADTKLT